MGTMSLTSLLRPPQRGAGIGVGDHHLILRVIVRQIRQIRILTLMVPSFLFVPDMYVA